MFKNQNRLKTNFEFNITRKHGKRHKGEYFSIFVLKPKDYKGPTKFGVVVPNKLHKKATKRNKLKRVFREILRKNLDIFPDNLWIVVHPFKNALDKSYEKISTDFNKTLQKISFSS
ncbi:MAG: ribonuclease P protein component [Candidatus Woesebacteria bacterium]|jgi:ribonuclease P protein component